MNTRVHLKELARHVGNGLTLYTDVDSRIGREIGTPKGALKHLFGFGMSYRELRKLAEDLVPIWDKIGTDVETFRIDYGASLPKQEADYLCILIRYVNAVRKAVSTLVEFQRLIHKRSEGEVVTIETSDQKLLEYKNVVAIYLEIGGELMAAWRYIDRPAP